MASNQTANFGLNQWEATDKVLREDFNADNAKIDAALAAAGNCKIAAGSYVGTGTYGKGSPTTLSFRFTPKLLLLLPYSDQKNACMASNGTPSLLAINWGHTETFTMYGTADVLKNHLSYSGNTVSWYNTSICLSE